MNIINFIVAHFSEIVAAVTGLFSAVIIICLMIPGDQPEKFLQSVVDVLEKFSKKKSEDK